MATDVPDDSTRDKEPVAPVEVTSRTSEMATITSLQSLMHQQLVVLQRMEQQQQALFGLMQARSGRSVRPLKKRRGAFTFSSKFNIEICNLILWFFHFQYIVPQNHAED